MKVILTEDVRGTGKKGDMVERKGRIREELSYPERTCAPRGGG